MATPTDRELLVFAASVQLAWSRMVRLLCPDIDTDARLQKRLEEVVNLLNQGGGANPVELLGIARALSNTAMALIGREAGLFPDVGLPPTTTVQ